MYVCMYVYTYVCMFIADSLFIRLSVDTSCFYILVIISNAAINI